MVTIDLQMLKAQLSYAIDKSFAMQDLLVKIPIRLAVDIESVLSDLVHTKENENV